MKASKKILGLTCGDPGGVGPEIILKALNRLRRHDKLERCSYLLLGPDEVYEAAHKQFNIKIPIQKLPFFDEKLLLPGDIALFSPPEMPVFQHPGKATMANARIAVGALDAAIFLAVNGLIQGIVTAPVSKTSIRKILPEFCGHTDYLADASRSKDVLMFFDTPRLRVGLATVHVSLSKVPSLLTKKLITSKLMLMNQFLKGAYQISKPRLAVAALNPHGQEFGSEEKTRITPAIQFCRKAGIDVTGPHPGDTIFYQASTGKYDAVLAMYHDQGLAPLKLKSFHEAVNVTLGLPFIRTSPDHGTAFDIAWKGKADSRSMEASIQLASRLI